MRTARANTTRTGVYAFEFVDEIQSSVALVERRELPSSKGEIVNYVSDLFAVGDPWAPVAFLENAIGDDIEQLRVIEDRIVSDERCEVVLLNAKEQFACDMATD